MAYTTPRTWVAGETVTASLLNTHLRDNLNAIAAVGIAGWSSFTPTWTSDGTAPAIGDGVVGGSYCQVGKLVVVRMYMGCGSTTTYGTGNYRWVSPVPLAVYGGPDSQSFASSVTVLDSGATRYTDFMVLSAASTYVMVRSGNSFVGAASPMTWAAGDSIDAFYVATAA